MKIPECADISVFCEEFKTNKGTPEKACFGKQCCQKKTVGVIPILYLAVKEAHDIWLSSHASQFRLHQKHKTGDDYHPDAFIDRPGYDETVGNLEKAYLRRLNK